VPIVVKLESAEGAILESLPDSGEVLQRTLPNYDDATFRLLTKIDWYGDAEFEPPQMGLFVEELQRIVSSAADAQQINYLERLRRIALRCGATPGSKLRFLGD